MNITERGRDHTQGLLLTVKYKSKKRRRVGGGIGLEGIGKGISIGGIINSYPLLLF